LVGLDVSVECSVTRAQLVHLVDHAYGDELNITLAVLFNDGATMRSIPFRGLPGGNALRVSAIPGPPPPMPMLPPSIPPLVSVHAKQAVTNPAGEGFVQQGGCSYDSAHSFWWKGFGQLDYVTCAALMSEKGLIMSPSYGDSGQFWYGPLETNLDSGMTGVWSTYVSDAVGSTSVTCGGARGHWDPSLYQLNDYSDWQSNTNTINGRSVEWKFKNYGVGKFDWCLKAASRAGASLVNPNTVGRQSEWVINQWGVWTTNNMMCNTYWWNNYPGNSFSIDSLGSGAQSESSKNCFLGFIVTASD